MDKLRGWILISVILLLSTCLVCLAVPVLEYGKLASPQRQDERVRRDISSVTDDDNVHRRCKVMLSLSNQPTTTSASPGPINLMELLNSGSKHMAKDKVVEDAVLIMGTKGSGTTTLAKILAQDIDNYHVYRKIKGDMVNLVTIVKGKQPGNALVPQLVLGRGQAGAVSTTAFYAFPDFDSSRAPEADIAANYFMRDLLMRKISRVKILFLLPHTTDMKGDIFEDFDLLVTQAAQLLANIPNYENSIALVITNMGDGGENNQSIREGAITNEIEKFMTDYLKGRNFSAGFQPQSDQAAVTKFQRKTDFVQTLLEQNEDREYTRISFIRSPSQCGPLTTSREIQEGRHRILRLSGKLEYTRVLPNYPVELDDQSILILRSSFTSINEEITDAVSRLMSNFMEFFLQKHLPSQKDSISKLEELEKATRTFEGMLSSWQSLQANDTVISPVSLSTLLISTLEAFEYPVEAEFKEFMELQQRYLEFEDLVNPPGNIRFFKYWISPVEMSRLKLVQLVELENQRKKIDSEWAEIMNVENKDKAMGLAIQKGNLEALNITITQGANVNAEFFYFGFLDNALSMAACETDKQVSLQMIKLLIRKGADPAHINFFGQTFLDYCAKNPPTPGQFHDLVVYLASKNLTLLFDTTDVYRVGLLMSYVLNMDVEPQTLSLLQANGVDLQAQDPRGYNLLYYASTGGRSTTQLSKLVKLGVDWAHRSRDGGSLVHMTAMQGKVEELKFFVELGLSINEGDRDGNTPLHYAASYDDSDPSEDAILKVIRYLIGKGADVEARNEKGETPYELAIMEMKSAKVTELLKHD